MNAAPLSVLAAARETPDSAALVAQGGVVWTWAGLAAEVAREAGHLGAIGIRPGQRVPVAFSAASTVETVVRFLCLVELGVPAALLHPRLTAHERRAQLAALGDAVDLDAAAGSADRPPLDPDGSRATPAFPRELALPGLADDGRALAVLFTSGSGGAPKGVELSRRAFVESARASEERLGWREDDRWLCALPLAHVGGLSILTRCLGARRAVVLLPAFDPGDVARSIERHRATLASLVPAMLWRLLEELPAWRPPDTVRAVLLGGAAAAGDVWTRGLERGWPLLETYGMTETCSQVATAAPGGPARALRPLRGFEVRVREDRLEVRGPSLMTRYLPPDLVPDPFTSDGWLRTADAGRLREDGTLELLGRADRTIVTGGEKVDAAEVESVLAALPGVRRALVLGLQDERWGEVVAALLETDRPDRPDAAALDRFLERRLAPFRRPRRLLWVDRLPETPSGKVDEPAARRLLLEGPEPG